MNLLSAERSEKYWDSLGSLFGVFILLTILMMLAVYGAIDGVKYRSACGAFAVLLGAAGIFTLIDLLHQVMKMELERRFGPVK